MATKNDLSATIRMLGDILGETIVEQEGQAIYELEEQIRGCSKDLRSGDAAAGDQLRQLIPALVADLPRAKWILQAFATYFQLVNLAEEHHRVQVLRQRSQKAADAGVEMDETIGEAIRRLADAGLSPAEVQQVLDQLFISPVYTAHPTESKRQTVQRILRRIAKLLVRYSSGDLITSETDDLRNELHTCVVLLWQTDTARIRRRTVMDEARNNGLYFFENTLFSVVPQIYDDVQVALRNSYPNDAFQVPAFLKYGTWIGGDRDGNPFVTFDVTRETLKAQKELVLNRYGRELTLLYEHLSQSTTRVKFSQEFLQSLDHDRQLLTSGELQFFERFFQEPYRQKLIAMYHRIQATRDQNQQPDVDVGTRAYAAAGEFWADLSLIQRSLNENRGERLSREVVRLMRLVEVFGFHLASMDIRQHSEKHDVATAELMQRNSICEAYSELEEAAKVELLEQHIETAGRLQLDGIPADELESIQLFELIRESKQHIATQAIESYIISMTEGVSDVLEVALFAQRAGLFGAIDIVPLFETIDDLQAAPGIMRALFESPVYKRHLAGRENRQQVMIGYSDSNKDGGFLRANWMLYEAQREIANVAHEFGICLTLFHGRGGSIGRGGGPANRAILAQPPGSVRGRIKITEQGEVVSSRYANPQIARRHLEQLVSAAIQTAARPLDANDPRSDWHDAMEELSVLAYDMYRQLVERPEFLEYFHVATPIDQIDNLNIGSRPAKRRSNESIRDLRAIPWVFAWNQTRVNLPSWFGVGTALDTWMQADSSRLARLRLMYEEWPFFRVLFDNVQLGLGKSDMKIAELYAGLATDEVREEIFGAIETEFRLSEKTVLQVTNQSQILECEPWLQRSIRVRNPYVDPMNYLQAALLKRLRTTASEDPDNEELIKRLIAAVRMSVNGIAAGVKNVG